MDVHRGFLFNSQKLLSSKTYIYILTHPSNPVLMCDLRETEDSCSDTDVYMNTYRSSVHCLSEKTMQISFKS